MTKITYYNGSIENVDEEIESIILESDYKGHSKEISDAMNKLIDKYWGHKVYYYRNISLDETNFENGFVSDFGSHIQFIKVEKVDKK